MGLKLYLAEAGRFVPADPVRGIERSDVMYSGYKIVVALDPSDAESKLVHYLKTSTRSDGWEKSSIKELTAGTDVPLAKRIEILGEIYLVI